MAFLRVRSGRFRKDMLVFHSRLGRRVRMSRPHRLFAQHREIVDQAFAGDVVGLVNPGLYAIGDTLSEERPLSSISIPRFPPERFAVLRVTSVIKQKQFQRGLRQLEEEGAIQVLLPVTGSANEPILAAVGELQFDVVQARLRNEYGVDTTLDRMPYTCALWIDVPLEAAETLTWPYFGSSLSLDRQGRLVGLFASKREAEYCQEKNPDVGFTALG
jgi:peptide chain release factor 3